MPHSLANLKSPLVEFQRQTMTHFVQECLSNPDKNIFSGMFCLLLGHAVLISDFHEALRSTSAYQKRLFSKNAMTDDQTMELAMAQHEGKIGPYKCATCRAVFLKEVLCLEERCLDHRSPIL